MSISRGWQLASIVLAVAAVERARAAEPVTLENVTPPGPNRADEPMIREFSPSAAVRFLDSTALSCHKEQKCFACHGGYSYLLARPVVSSRVPAHRHMRQSLERLAAYDVRAHLDAYSRPDVSKEEEWRFRRDHEVWCSRHPGISNCSACTENSVFHPRWVGGKAAQVFQDTVDSAIQSVLIGEKEVQEAMDEAKAKVDAALARA